MTIKVLASMKRPVSIKFMIHRRLAGWEKPRSHSTIHASDLMKASEFCPREMALLDMNLGKKKDSYVGTALRITFDHGKDTEHRVRNDWLRDVVVGYWTCNVCGNEHGVFGKVPKVKCKCGHHRWDYTEPRFTSKENGVSGGLDFLADVGEAKLRIVEIKTLDKDEHKKLVAPLAEHKFRTSLYMRLVEESDHDLAGRVNLARANILYISKSYGFKDLTLKENGIPDSPFSPFKEFEIARDDTSSDVPLAKARVLTAWRKDDSIGMPAGVCTNLMCSRAGQCPVASACFSSKYPAKVTWLEKGVPRHEGKKVL